MSDIDKARRRKISYTLSDALKGYRGTLRLSQQELADLTFELAEQGIVTHGIAQQHISRIEKGDVPQETTLRVIAATISEAFNRDGWETTPDEIMRHLRNAKGTKVQATEVSEEAAKLDAMIAPMPERLRLMIWRMVFALVESFQVSVDEDRREQRRQKIDITTRNNKGEADAP